MEVKPRDAFSPDRRSRPDGLQSICKACRRVREREWRAANPDEAARRARAEYVKHKARRSAYSREWHRKNPEKRRVYALKARYGLTAAQRDAMLAAQGGKCAICGTAKQGQKGFHTDHDHATGAVRGLICGGCNIALGFIERPGFLDAALAYLHQHRSSRHTLVA